MLPLFAEPGYGVLPESGAAPLFAAAVEPALLPESIDGPIWTGELSICGEYPYPGGGAGSVRTMEVYGDWPETVGLALSTTVVGVPTAFPEIGTSTGVAFPGTKEYP